MEYRRIPLPRPERLAAFPPSAIEDAVERLISALDQRGGDPDLEQDALEDDFLPEWFAEAHADGPGCTISDAPGHGWRERIDQSDTPYGPHGSSTIAAHDEAENDDPMEDDDPGGGNVTDEPHDPEEDRCLAGDDGVFSGPVADPLRWAQWVHHEIGSEDDAEENGDVELNGDEGDYGGEVTGV